MHQLYTWICVPYPETLSGEDAAVYFGMQIGEAAGEFHFFAVHGDAAIGAAAAVAGFGGQIFALEREEPAHVGVGQFEFACHAAGLTQRHGAMPHVTEPPQQQIEEMHTDVGGDTTGLLGVALPGIVVPEASCCDVCEVDLVPAGLLIVSEE